jgi:hypothetical protein
MSHSQHIACSLFRCHISYIVRYVEEKNETNNNISCYKNKNINENVVKIVFSK